MITDNFSRKNLNEGRNYGFGFAFLKKIKKGVFESLTPFSACKDYLNDFIYVETTNKPLETIFGFKHEYTGILKKKKYFYFAFKAVHYKNKDKWEDFDKLTELINSNINNLILFINKLEILFKLKTKTKLELLEEGTVILKVPIFWSKFGFLISLYSLYIRCFINITEEDLNKDINILITEHNKFFIYSDNMLFQGVKILVKNDNLEKILKYKYPNIINNYQIHSFGISARLGQIKNEE